MGKNYCWQKGIQIHFTLIIQVDLHLSVYVLYQNFWLFVIQNRKKSEITYTHISETAQKSIFLLLLLKNGTSIIKPDFIVSRQSYEISIHILSSLSPHIAMYKLIISPKCIQKKSIHYTSSQFILTGWHFKLFLAVRTLFSIRVFSIPRAWLGSRDNHVNRIQAPQGYRVVCRLVNKTKVISIL